MLLWVRLWDLSWQMPSCVISRNNCKQQNKMPEVYKRNVDDTIRVITDVETDYLTTLNNNHPSIDFTMELEENGRLPFLGMEVMKDGCSLNTKVQEKPTDSGLLLHYHSHVDGRYKLSLLNSMLYRTSRLSSTWKFFHKECERLKEAFARLCYSDNLVHSTIRQFVESKVSEDSGTQVS